MIHRFFRRSAAPKLLAPKLIALGLVAAVFASGCSDTMEDAATFTYTIDGEEVVMHVDRDEFEDELASLNEPSVIEGLTAQSLPGIELAPAGAVDTDLAALLLQLILNDALNDAAIEHFDVEYDEDAEPDDSQLPPDIQGVLRDRFAVQQAKDAAIREHLQRDVDLTEPTEAEMRAYYDERIDQYEACPADRNVEIVAYAIEADAQAAADSLESGDAFEEVAATAPQSENVCLDSSQGAALIPDDLGSAPLDTVVGPVEVDGGFIVYRVSAWAPSFEKSRADVQAEMMAEAQQAAEAAVNDALGAFYDELLGSLDVKADPRYARVSETPEEDGSYFLPPAVADPPGFPATTIPLAPVPEDSLTG